MTREEAIEVLGKMKYPQKVNKNGFIISNVNIENEALDMAIKALSQEPTEKPMTVDEMEREYEKSKALFHKIAECDDAISRQAVLKLMDEYNAANVRQFGRPITGIASMRTDVRDLPSVNAIQHTSNASKDVEQHTNTLGDAVSREAVDNYIVKLLDSYLYAEERTRLENLCAYLWELPSVTQKSGKWLIKDRYYHDTITAECSECHREVEIPTCMEELMYDFCPICGARMVEPQESEE